MVLLQFRFKSCRSYLCAGKWHFGVGARNKEQILLSQQVDVGLTVVASH